MIIIASIDATLITSAILFVIASFIVTIVGTIFVSNSTRFMVEIICCRIFHQRSKNEHYNETKQNETIEFEFFF